jgi:RNA ligase
MKYDLDILNKYMEDGLVVKQDHPTLPLSVYNYSRTCQYNNNWDEITLACRGLILDNEGNLVASSFTKFFNYEELIWTTQIPQKGDYVYVQEKVDGSLGTLFFYNGEWHLATKGSFASEQAIKGMEIIRSKYTLKAFMTDMVYICEIIYPENRIVVDYNGEEKVVFLSVTSKGEELHWTTAKSVFHASGIPEEDLVKTEQSFAFGPGLYKRLKERNEANKEGFILRFQPGNFRMKIKFEDYVRLHRILTGFSSKDIWEILMKGEDLEQFLDRVPDEFYKWVRSKVLNFQWGLYSIRERCGKIHDYFRYGKYNDREDTPTKKDFALHLEAKNVDPALRAICFAIWDDKPYEHIIWKLLKPKYEKPFWSESES